MASSVRASNRAIASTPCASSRGPASSYSRPPVLARYRFYAAVSKLKGATSLRKRASVPPATDLNFIQCYDFDGPKIEGIENHGRKPDHARTGQARRAPRAARTVEQRRRI